jgi:MFS family permease
MDNAERGLPPSIIALFVVRLVVSAGSFVGPFLTMMLTIKLGFDETRAGFFMAAVSVVSAFGLALGGKLGDSFGRAGVLRSLQAITALAFIACGVLGFTELTPFIIALAMGSLSGTWPVINALVADRAPEGRRKEAFSLLYWGNNIGFSIGPLIAGFLFDKAPRALFFGNAAALLIAAAVVSAFVRGKDPIHAEPAGPASGPLGESAGGQADVAARSAAAARALGSPAKSTLWTVLAANPVLVLYGLSSVLVAFVYNQHTFALPLFLKDVLGSTEGPKAYGLTMMANGLTVVVLTALVAFVSKRMAALAAVALGSVFYAAGFGGYYFAVTVPLVISMTVIWTIGEILGATNGNAFIAERAPPAYRSRINSAISLCYIVGNTLSPLAAGPLVRRFGSAALWPVIAALSLLSALLIFGIHVFDGRAKPRVMEA